MRGRDVPRCGAGHVLTFVSDGSLSFLGQGGEFRAAARGSFFICLRRPLFFQQRKKRGKETPPKTTFLDFLTRLHLPLILLFSVHADVVPLKFHLNIALSLLLFSLPLLL